MRISASYMVIVPLLLLKTQELRFDSVLKRELKKDLIWLRRDLTCLVEERSDLVELSSDLVDESSDLVDESSNLVDESSVKFTIETNPP